MEELSVNIKKNNRILLARNAPVALVLGAGSFFGSHIVDKLLSKDIQVIGIDDLNSTNKLNLTKASESRNFHLIGSVEDFDLDLDRLDYIFIVPQKNQTFKWVFEHFKKFKPRYIGLAAFITDYSVVIEMAREIKKTFNIPIIIGNAQVT